MITAESNRCVSDMSAEVENRIAEASGRADQAEARASTWAEAKIREETKQAQQRTAADYAASKSSVQAAIESLRNYQDNQGSQSRGIRAVMDQARESALKLVHESHQKADLLARELRSLQEAYTSSRRIQDLQEKMSRRDKSIRRLR